MNIKETLSSIGWVILSIIFFVVIIGVVVLFIAGGAWLADKLLPILLPICIIVLITDVIVFGPLALIPRTRSWAGIGLYISSYIFGITGWFLGLLLTWTLWGTTAVIIGLLIFGIGVVPIAILATLFNGMWFEFAFLLVVVILTFGIRTLGAALADE